MARENSFSDEDRSVTPDLSEDEKSRAPAPAPRKSTTSQRTQPKSPAKSSHSQRRPAEQGQGQGTRNVTFVGQPPKLRGKELFRASVNKVIHMSRSSSYMSKIAMGAGAEPGIDVRRDSAQLLYGHIRQQCVIEMVDYSSIRASFGKMTNKDFVNYLSDSKACTREPWVKVRWINIGGISWDVIRALAIKYNLHPLALEDILHHPNRLRSKADYYPQHLFMRIISHTLAEDGQPVENYVEDLPRSESPEPFDPEDKDYYSVPDDDYFSSTSSGRSKTMMGGSTLIGKKQPRKRPTIKPVDPDVDVEMSAFGRDRPDPSSARFATFDAHTKIKDANTKRLIEELKEGDRVNVALNPMCIFLFRDGTVISMHPKPNLDFTAPIRERLRQRHTGIRKTADASLLVHGLLDLVVDNILGVVDEYQRKIVKLEHDILLRPKMKSVRFLHILSGDLTLHKRTLEPIKTVVYGLRRYDRDRVAAMYDERDLPEGWKAEGFMSHKANIYLADVNDHMEYIMSSLDMFASISENLISYTFNMASYQMNEVMRKLTLVSIVCLPLTLFTGYFGMNFDPFWAVNNNSDRLFWEIAIPVMLVLMPLLLWQDIVKAYHYGQKNVWVKKANRKLKKA